MRFSQNPDLRPMAEVDVGVEAHLSWSRVAAPQEAQDL